MSIRGGFQRFRRFQECRGFANLRAPGNPRHRWNLPNPFDASRYDQKMAGWNLEQTYTQLPQIFWTPATPTTVREPRLAVFNRPLAAALGLDATALDGPDGAAVR